MYKKYDAIIIGSGIGGLTCGAFLARAGFKVCVLEQHRKIGGYAHSFKRKKYVFDSGIHSVPMGDTGLIMHFLRLLGIENAVETIPFKETFHMRTPDFSETFPAKREEIDQLLCTLSGGGREQLKEFKKQVSLFQEKIIEPIYHYEDRYVEEDKDFVTRYHNRSYKDFVDSMFAGDRARQLIYGQWPYGGLTPGYGANVFFFIMFLIHYLDGSHYCKGGFSVLAEALAGVITRAGGKVHVKTKVTSLITENKEVTRVKTLSGEEFDGRCIVSNISPYLIHNSLLDEKGQARRWQRRLGNLNPSTSCVISYLGMKPSFFDFLDKDITFWYADSDVDRICRRILEDRKDHIDHLILLKNPIKKEYPTLTLMNFVQMSYSQDWSTDKMRLHTMMLDKAEELYPGISDHIELVEVGSPRTFERYTLNTGGALYGFENIKTIYGEAKMPITTHLKNLYQTGHWGKPGCGVWNVMVNGYTTSKIVLQNHA